MAKTRKRAPQPAAAAKPPERDDDLPTAHAAVAVVLFDRPDVDIEEVEPEFARRTLLESRVRPFLTSGPVTPGTVALEVGPGFVSIVRQPGPYHQAGLEHAISTAWTFPADREPTAVNTARAHVSVVATSNGGPSVRRHLIATAFAAFVAEMPGAIAVYWPAGDVLHPAGHFAATATRLATLDAPPVELWTNFLIEETGRTGLELLSLGLRDLGMQEFDILGWRGSASGLREAAIAISAAIVTGGENAGLAAAAFGLEQVVVAAAEPGEKPIRFIPVTAG